MLAAAAAFATALLAGSVSAQVYGSDVSHYQGSIDWSSVASQGSNFAYIKCTQSTSSTDAQFANNYNGAYNAGLIRGAYHFAIPSDSDGATQANYFISNGGGWSGDGYTLPGAVDMEPNPYGATCYGLSQSAMVQWVSDFSNTYANAVGVYPVIYTSNSWWTSCTGNSNAFSGQNALWIARYSSAVGTIPGGWSGYYFWQYSETSGNPYPGDQDVFNGAESDLQSFATNGY